MSDRKYDTVAAKAAQEGATALIESHDVNEEPMRSFLRDVFLSSLGANMADRVAGDAGTLTVLSYYNEPWSTNVWEAIAALFFCEYAQKKQPIKARRRDGIHEATARMLVGRQENREVASIIADAIVAQARKVGVALQKELSRGAKSKDSTNLSRQKGNAKTRDTAEALVEYAKTLKDAIPQDAREIYVRESQLARAVAGQAD